jgi:hypothetical protein
MSRRNHLPQEPLPLDNAIHPGSRNHYPYMHHSQQQQLFSFEPPQINSIIPFY